jgi:hypothetical protein
LKEQKIRVKNTTFNKYTGLGLLGAAMVAWYTWKQNKDVGSDRTGEGERLPGGKVGGGAGGVGGGGAGGGGAVVGRPPDFDPAADVAKAQMDSKTIPVPDYYDELTYKKYVNYNNIEYIVKNVIPNVNYKCSGLYFKNINNYSDNYLFIFPECRSDSKILQNYNEETGEIKKIVNKNIDNENINNNTNNINNTNNTN